jgi:hypothetical protein
MRKKLQMDKKLMKKKKTEEGYTWRDEKSQN